MRWMEIARSYDGLAEIKGAEHNPLIVKMAHDCGATWVIDDETPWCGFFVGHCVKLAGLPLPANPGVAASWLAYGSKLDKPREGCIAVIRSSGTNSGFHVGFYERDGASGRIDVRGGNQGDKAQESSFPANAVAEYRWPIATKTPQELAAEGSRIAATGETIKSVAKVGTGAAVTVGGGIEVASKTGVTQAVGEWTTTITTFQSFGTAMKTAIGWLGDIWPLLVLAGGLALYEVGNHLGIWRAQDHNAGKTS